jgi:hypothetical protein
MDVLSGGDRLRRWGPRGSLRGMSHMTIRAPRDVRLIKAALARLTFIA